jgi:hypothetical protein
MGANFLESKKGLWWGAGVGEIFAGFKEQFFLGNDCMGELPFGPTRAKKMPGGSQEEVDCDGSGQI